MVESSQPPVRQRFALRPRPPVRPLALAAVATVAGAALVVLVDNLAIRTVGAVVLGLGVALALLAAAFWYRLRSAVSLDVTGVTLTRSGRDRTLAWSEVEEVVVKPMRLTLVAKSGRPLIVVNPQPETAPVLADLAVAVRQRLDGNRGYRSLG